MSLVPRPPLSRRLPPGAWTAAAWAVATVFSLLSWDAAHKYSVVLAPMPGLPAGFRSQGHLFRPHEIALLACAALLTLAGSALARRAPLAAVAVLLAGAVVATLYQSPLMMLQFLPVDVALYLAAAHRARRTAAAALVLTVATVIGCAAVRMLAGPGAMLGVVALPAEQAAARFPMDFIIAVTAVLAWTVGICARQAREHAAAVAGQAATAERLRLSHELHDGVAHSIGIIAVLAGAARRVIQTQPAQAQEALAGIETTSRETLTGLQQMLRTLRDAEPGSPAAAPPRGPASGAASELLPGPASGPASGLGDLDRLVALAWKAGVRVEVTWRGERRTLPAEIDLAAFRIVQEALTNVVRHARTDACRVEVRFERDGVALEILDDGGAAGAARASDAGGFGLLGMRERVTALSGQFTAGPRPQGGFRVSVSLPT